jgi:hypothetical protein
VSEPGAQTIGPYRQGEIPPPLTVTFRDSLQAAIDLTGYAGGFVYRMHTASGWPDYTAADPAAVSRSAVVAANQSTNKGQVTYTWVAADFATAGYYEAEMWAGLGPGTNRLASVRFMWIVLPNLGVVPSI